MKRNLFLTLILSMAVSTAYAEETWVTTAETLADTASAWEQETSFHTSESHKPEGYTNHWYGTHTTGNWKVEGEKLGINNDGLTMSDATANGLDSENIGINAPLNIGCYKGAEKAPTAPASLAVQGEGTEASTGNCLYVGGKGWTNDVGHDDFWQSVSPQEGFLTVRNGATLTVGTAATKALGAQLNVGQGESGVGHLLVDNGNVVSNAIMTVGNGTGAHGDMLVENGGAVTVQATEEITTAGTALHIGVGEGSVGHITVDGGSSLSVLGSLNEAHKGASQTFIGQDANSTGDLTVKNLSSVQLDGVTMLGYADGARGTINVESGSKMNLNNTAFAGVNGEGAINVDGSNSMLISTASIRLGYSAGGDGELNITNGATVLALGNVEVGRDGTGKLTNNGTLIGEALVNGNGELHGSGTFGAAQVMGGGKVFVGDRATATQTYTGNVQLEESTTTFSVTDLTVPSAETQTAWVSQEHSLIKMESGTRFSITEDTRFIIEFCGDVLPTESDTVNLGDFSILLVEGGVDSNVVTSALCDTLLSNTTFSFTQGSLENPVNFWATTIDRAHYLVANNNLYLVAGSIPEPTTATLSLLALAGLCARRRRK